jgi:hypothetical protein
MEQDDREEVPRERPPTPRAGKWIEWASRGSRGWKWMRRLLLATEAGCVLTKHEAPAAVARALVVIGDVIFSKPGHG